MRQRASLQASQRAPTPHTRARHGVQSPGDTEAVKKNRQLWARAVMVSRLAEGEPVETAIDAAGIHRATYYRWRAQDTAFAAALDDAELNGKLYLFYHERYEAERRREELLTRYIVATTTGDLAVLPPELAVHALSILPREPAPGFEYSPRVGTDGVLRRHLWKERTPQKKSRPLCGAKTRCGGSCTARVIVGRSRCRLHGGLSPLAEVRNSEAPVADEALYEQARQRSRSILKAMHLVFCFGAPTGEAAPDPSRSARA